jgi:hypothetical protein
LDEAFIKQIDLAKKILSGARWVGSLSMEILPQAKLLLASVYLILGGYVVLTGADYVDARRFRLLGRVPGVRQVVEKNLTIS